MDIGFAALLAQAARERPDHPALVVPASASDSASQTWTYAQLDAWVERVRAGLGRLGMVAGYRIALALGDTPEAAVTTLAAWRAGLTVVPVPPGLGSGRLARLLVHTDARLLVAALPRLAEARNALSGLSDALVGAEAELRQQTTVPTLVSLAGPILPGEVSWTEVDAAAEQAPRPALAAPDVERLALIMFPTGYSGSQRGPVVDEGGAMLSHRAITSNVEQVAQAGPFVTPDDVVLGALPLWHIYGLCAVLGAVLRQQATLVLIPEFGVEKSLSAIREHQVTVAPIAPPILRAWLGAADLDALAGLRVVVSGSAPIAPAEREAFERRTGHRVFQGYGLTEAGPVVTSALSAESEQGSTSASRQPDFRTDLGLPVPGTLLQIRDSQGNARRTGDLGDIWVKGDQLFSGYWPEGDGGPNREGWFATGDIGYLSQHGTLVLVERADDVVVVEGFTVYPSEVRAVVADVIGSRSLILRHDEDGLAALLGQPEPGVSGVPATAEVAELAPILLERWARQLASYKRPTRVLPLDGEPSTVSGPRSRQARRRSKHRLVGDAE